MSFNPTERFLDASGLKVLVEKITTFINTFRGRIEAVENRHQVIEYTEEEYKQAKEAGSLPSKGIVVIKG